MSDMEAVYNQNIFPDHKGNPLIEALPCIGSEKDLLRSISEFPEYNVNERSKPQDYRVNCLHRLSKLRYPLKDYLKCFNIVHRSIIDGYSTKNPLSASTNHFLHFIDYEDSVFAPRTGILKPNAHGATIIGPSGVGKSKMIEQVLGFYPQLIIHQKYGTVPLPIKQVVWMHIECPFDSSIRGLCHAILSELDGVLGERTTPAKTLDPLLTQIERRIRSSFVGVIIIDEIQNISVNKVGGENKFLKFLLNLINRSGTPIVICGNPEATEILKKKFKIARRFETGGYIPMYPLSKEVWDIFIKVLWKYQWTNTKTPLTEEISKKMFEYSGGIIDVAVRIYRNAQELVIGSQDESINPEVLEYAYCSSCQLTSPALSLLKTQDKDIIRSIYPDLLNDDFFHVPEIETSAIKNSGLKKAKETKGDKKSVTIPSDITKCPHDEFLNQTTQLMNDSELFNKIEDPRLIRRLFKETTEPLSELEKGGVILNKSLMSLKIC